MVDRQTYINKYASLKEMEMQYLSEKNKLKFEQEQKQKRSVKGPKDFKDIELSPNVINIQTITGKFGEDMQHQVYAMREEEEETPEKREGSEMSSPGMQREHYP